MKLRPRLSARGDALGDRTVAFGAGARRVRGAGPKRGAFRLWAALPSLVLLHCLDILKGYATLGPFYHLPSAHHRHRLAKMSKSTRLGRGAANSTLSLGLMLALAGTRPLASCSTMGGDIPTAIGGMPDGAPERPQAPPAYPAVHDMPPARNTKVMTEEEKKRVGGRTRGHARSAGQARPVVRRQPELAGPRPGEKRCTAFPC